MSEKKIFQEEESIKRIAHYLPNQAPLKDFILLNTLASFQKQEFFDALNTSSSIFGYKVSLSITEFRSLYKRHRIREDILEAVIIRHKGKEAADEWIHKLFHKKYKTEIDKRIKHLRGHWFKNPGLDMDAFIHSKLFKILGNYLDQGISSWKFPYDGEGFLSSLRELEKNSLVSLFKTKRAKELFFNSSTSITSLLDLLVKDESLYEQYLFDQQFSHPGWSGLVAVIEKKPESLFDTRVIKFEEIILLELLFELDELEANFKGKWKPLGETLHLKPVDLFAPVAFTEEFEVIAMWQEAFEWSYYDEVLAGIIKMKDKTSKKQNKSFQALFCIDDREGSIRRHIETFDPNCETYGTPGFFGVEFYYKPHYGKFHTKVCPAPLNPKYLIKEIKGEVNIKKDIHFSKNSHHPIFGFFYSMVVGFLSGYRLFLNIFKPSASPAASFSFSHMGKDSKLTIECLDTQNTEYGLQIGFTTPEMVDRVEKVLKSIGLITDFGEIIYVIGHGASSINNPYYAEYDCGACSSRPGSVNARVFSSIANDQRVRDLLKERGIDIPSTTQFLGGLHDTTRDEFEFYDEHLLSEKNKAAHEEHLKMFEKALDMNAKERSRRFFSVNTKQTPAKIHEEIRNRSVSLFEPRPELNHATNSLCIVGRHSLNEGLFLDRRAFSNSYDYAIDPNGVLLEGILNAAVPVCGGINLAYYFSRVDNQRFGAGSKLPHNVMGLIGVSNGVEGDLRPGLALQMIEVHDPIRILFIVEHFPDVLLDTIKRNKNTYEWFDNAWVNLVAVHPETYDMYVFRNGEFTIYHPLKKLLDTIANVDSVIESHEENFPVYLIKK